MGLRESWSRCKPLKRCLLRSEATAQCGSSHTVYRVLKPVAEFTDMLSGENYAVLSSRLPILAHLENVLEESEEDA